MIKIRKFFLVIIWFPLYWITRGIGNLHDGLVEVVNKLDDKVDSL